MKKKFLISVLAVLVVVALSSVVLAACDTTPKNPAASITVSFDLGDYEGAGNAPADVKVDKGGEVTLPNVGVTWTDHVFMGWSSDDGATVKAAGDKVVVDVDVEFVAQWADAVTVTFVDKDGETVLGTSTVSKSSTVSENYPYAGVAEVKWYVVREGAITTDEFVPGTGAGATVVTDAITVQKKVVVNPAFLNLGEYGDWYYIDDDRYIHLVISTSEGVNTFEYDSRPIEFEELDASPKGGYVFSYSYPTYPDGEEVIVSYTYRAAYDSAKNVVNVYEIVDGVEGEAMEFTTYDYVDIDYTYNGIWNNVDGYRLTIDWGSLTFVAPGVEEYPLVKGNAADGYTFVVDDTTYHFWLDGEDMKLCVAGQEADAMTLTYSDPSQGGGEEGGGGSQNPEDYITVTFQDPEGNAIAGLDDSSIRYEKMFPMDFSAAESEIEKELNQYVKWYLVVDGEVTDEEIKNGDSAPTEDITVRATIVDYTAATISADDYGTYNDVNGDGKTLTISAEGITLVMPWGITYTATVENVYQNPHGDGYVAVVSYSFLEPGEEEPTVLQTLYTFGKVGGGWEVYETSYGSDFADFFPEA